MNEICVIGGGDCGGGGGSGGGCGCSCGCVCAFLLLLLSLLLTAVAFLAVFAERYPTTVAGDAVEVSKQMLQKYAPYYAACK